MTEINAGYAYATVSTVAFPLNEKVHSVPLDQCLSTIFTEELLSMQMKTKFKKKKLVAQGVT
jgi:hypothetical protein